MQMQEPSLYCDRSIKLVSPGDKCIGFLADYTENQAYFSEINE